MTPPTPPTPPNFTPSRRASRAYRSDKLEPSPAKWEDLQSRMEDWMDDMIGWGQDVRDDIIRLEAAAGLPTGDPADPPPRPWR